jgi:hypothetical protein
MGALLASEVLGALLGIGLAYDGPDDSGAESRTIKRAQAVAMRGEPEAISRTAGTNAKKVPTRKTAGLQGKREGSKMVWDRWDRLAA